MREVLFVTTAFPPTTGSGVQRVMRLIRWLPSTGYRPVVLTTGGKNTPDLDLRLETDNRIDVLRASSPLIRAKIAEKQTRRAPNAPISVAANSRKLRQRAATLVKRLTIEVLEFPDQHNLWIWPALRVGTMSLRTHQYHCVYATAPWISAHVVGALIARRAGIPLVIEFRDLWVGNPWNYHSQSSVRRRLDAWLERWLVKESARIITVSPGSAAILVKRYGGWIADRISVVSHGFDPDEFPPNIPNIPAPTVPLTLVYPGILYGGRRDMNGFLKAIRTLIDANEISDNDISLTVAGDGGYTAGLAQEYGLTGLVRDVGRVSVADSLRLQASAHLLLLVEAAENTEWVLSNLPGKLFEYLGARRPILALIHPDSIMAQIIQDSNTGVSFLPDDVSQIADYLLSQVKALKESGTIQFDPCTSEVEKYHWRSVIGQLGSILDSL